MRLLAIDTTDWNTSVALWENGEELSFQEKAAERDQAALLPQLVQEVIDHTKIDFILVNRGPGSFTGIRVGLAFAKGLSLGWNIPLRGMDSFTATYNAIEPIADVLVLIDAKRTDVFAQRFLGGVPQAPQSLTRGDLERILSAVNPPFLGGSGVHPFLDGLVYEEVLSPWRGAQQLAYAFFKDPSIVSEPLPFYVREADVTCA